MTVNLKTTIVKRVLPAMKVYLLLVSLILVVIILPSSVYSQSQTELVSCRDNPVDPPSVPPGNNFKYRWEADCSSQESKACKVNSDCPQTDDPAVRASSSNWCYEFLEGNRCLKLEAIRKHSVAEKRIKKMKSYLEGLEKFNKVEGADKAREILTTGIKNGEECLKEKDQAKRDACKLRLKDNFGKSKAAYRLVKYYSILAGRSKTCAEADIGMKPRLLGTSIDKHKEQRRLFFCSGERNQIDKLNIKWRVKSKDGTKLVRVTEDYSLEPGEFPNKNQVSEAEKKVGL